MRTVHLLVLASLMSVLAVGSAAVSAPPSSTTIESCAALLPKGKSYTFSLTGTIDNTGTQPRLSGELSVSDNATVDKSQEGAAFAQCTSKLVR